MSIYDLGEMENRRRKAMERQKKPPTGSAEALTYCIEQAANSKPQPIELSRQLEYIKSQAARHRIQDVSKLTDCDEAARCLGYKEADAMSDDPIEWLVKEFGAEYVKKSASGAFAYIVCKGREPNWLILYHADYNEWEVFSQLTAKPLTRADVARLCELFGVQVRR